MNRILHVNATYSEGGAAQIARTLHQQLNKKSEFVSYFAHGRGKKSTNENVYKFTLTFEVYLHALITRLIGLEGSGTFLSTKKLINFVEKSNFSIIHLHNIHGYYLNFEFIKFLKEFDVSVVWTLHDGWAMTGNCAYWFKCKKWESGCLDCNHKDYYPKNYINFSNLMWNKKKKVFSTDWDPILVTPSKWLADKVSKSFLGKHEIKTIPNAIDTDLFRPQPKTSLREKFNLTKDNKILLFAASDLENERKGAKYFFESLKYVNVDDLVILTIGKKIKAYKNINKDIKQLGYISNRKLLSEIYNEADLFCTTSLDEVFGLTVTEAMSSGTPVVAFNVGGIAEQITEDCGLLVEPRNIKELANKLKELLINDQKRKKMSLNSRKRAVNKYSINKFSKDYFRLYQDILEEE